MGYAGLVAWFKHSLLRATRFKDFVGEDFSVPADGDGICLCFGVGLHGDGFGSLFCGNLECWEEYSVAIIWSFCE